MNTETSNNNNSATIKLHLIYGDSKQLRTAEITHRTGLALAAPRTEFNELLRREELKKPGIYLLISDNPDNNEPTCYIGEAETLADRLKQHKEKDWNQAIVFISKDENLTKSHIKYIEGHLIKEASKIGKVKLENKQSSTSKLSESDKSYTELFIQNIQSLLPVLGVDFFIPVISKTGTSVGQENLIHFYKNLKAYGRRTHTGFVVFKDSEAALDSDSEKQKYPTIKFQREKLKQTGILQECNEYYIFTNDFEFGSPSTAAAVIRGNRVNGLTAWRNQIGKTLKEIEAE